MHGSSTDKDKRVALVTGAGSAEGIGFATVRLLGQEGFDIAITSTTERIEDRERELSDCGIEALSFATDLMKLRNAEILAEQTIERYGRIDVLINNAGMAQIGHPDVVKRLAELDDGRILNVASVTGPIVSNPGMAAYSAVKAAMIGLTRSLALEVARKGITVNAVAPGGSRPGPRQSRSWLRAPILRWGGRARQTKWPLSLHFLHQKMLPTLRAR